MLVIFLRDMSILADLVGAVFKHHPESFESYDDHTFKLVFKLFPQIAKRLKRNIFAVAWSFLPEVGMVLTGGVPKLVLLAEFTGESEMEVNQAVLEAQKAVH